MAEEITYTQKSAAPRYTDEEVAEFDRRQVKTSPLTFGELIEFVAEAANTAARAVEQRLTGKLAELERHLTEFKYLGVYEPGRSYNKQNSVSHRGGLWVATVDTTQQPGDSPDWCLAVRRGRDGKGAS